jgi:dUTPase
MKHSNPTFKFALTDELTKLCEKNGENPYTWLPTRSNDTDTGWDVKCAMPISIRHGEYVKIPLGFRAFSPPGWWLKLVPRSSTFIKKRIHALYGVIDETYSGEIAFCGQFIENSFTASFDSDYPESYKTYNDDLYYSSIQIKFGERIGQIIPVRREEMNVKGVSNEEFDKLCAERNASRGSGGFGSTGML